MPTPGGSPLNGNLDDAADQPEYETIAHARPQLGDTVAGQPQYEIIAQEHPLSEASSLAGSPAGSPAREYEVPLVTPSTPQHHIYHTLEQVRRSVISWLNSVHMQVFSYVLICVVIVAMS